MIYKRKIQDKIESFLFQGKAILLFGPRQAGKTTLSKLIISKFGQDGDYFNCEELGVRKYFRVGEPDLLKELVADKKIVVFDEAQTIENIGAILKVFLDKYPTVQVVATGSSSFDLANKINEPLTGRSFEFTLYPLSVEEIKITNNIAKNDLFNFMCYGMYPGIVLGDSQEKKEFVLKNITTNYMYKDIFIFENIHKPQVFEDLVKILAYQIGNLISINKLATELGVSRLTIEKYINLLEQSYIIKVIRSFAKNKRGELKKAFKIYFVDLGIRNAVIDDLTPDLESRKDKGVIFENFAIMELFKQNSDQAFPPDIMFWRTETKLEIDIITLKNSQISAYECKWSDTNIIFNTFLRSYKDAKAKVLIVDSFLQNDNPFEFK